MKRSLLFKIAVGYLIALIVAAALSGVISGYSYDEGDIKEQYASPSLKHIMGTDIQGRDLFARILYGARISLLVGFIATFISLSIGVVYGSIAGFYGGFIDSLMMRLVDILYGLPFIAFVIIIMVIFRDVPSDTRLILVFIVLGCVQWLTIARVIRAEVLKIKKMGFVESALALGTTKRNILLKHILPNIYHTIIVFGTLTVPAVILEESFLSFLGLGIQPPRTSWGLLISEGAFLINKHFDYWWLLIFPSAFLVLTLLALNFIGESLKKEFGF